MIDPQAALRSMHGGALTPDRALPASAVMCYQTSLLGWVKKAEKTESLGGLPGVLLPERNVAVCGGFGFGAPAAVSFLEGLVASGVRRIISIGTAGSLRQAHRTGDIVVCTEALRDEGTSHHYVVPQRFARPSAELTEELCRVLNERREAYVRGPSWTTDAPYRETAEEVRIYGAEGILAVEMEAAALFAVGAFRGVQVAALFAVSDTLTGGVWKPHFRDDRTRQGLVRALKAALDTLGRG